MIKTYRKTTTIQAEQFDGSQKMVRNYPIGVMPIMMIDRFINLDDESNWSDRSFNLQTLEGKMSLRVGDWIATGIDGEHWAIADSIFKQTYEEAAE